MATRDDSLDDFFKKKDKKGTKHKKQTGSLTNNEELLKQLVIVTSATSAFKENMNFDEDDDVEVYNRDEKNGINNTNNDDNHGLNQKNQSHTTSINSKPKTSTKLTVQDNNHISEQQPGGNEQQDEWEEFEGGSSKYEALRLKFKRGINDGNHMNEDEENDDYDDDNENNHETNTDDNKNHLNGNDDGQPSRTNNRRREQQKDKPVWKMDQVKQSESTIQSNDSVDSSDKKVEEPAPVAKSNVYRPPHLSGKSSVTIVSGANQRPSKKDKPNLASTDEFPTLGAAVNKK